MLKLKDEGVVLEEDWGWPVSIVEMVENEESLFWMVWCAAKNGDRSCECQSTPPVGTGATKESALESWRFIHFERRYQGRRRQ
ncbi:hypothetical protein LCGC14_0449020 [marine sediment metagenome]|uniref:Uncharacterized protein n=1 Tax=marine sediment metagenome TaxID=412755 RepID=A0A0F9V596_9ZZZZ